MSLAPEAVVAGPPRRPRSAALGAVVLSGANVVRLAAQLALLPILARLVGPAEYGLVALAMPFILFCNVLADAGLSPALARRQDPSPQLESTVFWVSGGIGLSLALAAALLSIPIGLALGQPRLPWLIMALAPILALSGATAAANARVIRERRFGVFAAGDMISTGLSGAVAVAAALAGWGAWSLVAQQLVLWVCKAAWVISASRLPIRLHCRPSEAADLFRFGGHNVGATLGDFVSRNAHSLIIGAALGALPLGYYAMAYQIIRVPDLIISGPLYLLIFSTVAQAAAGASPRSASEIALAALRLAATGLAPVFTGLGLTAGLAVAVVLGPKWLEVSPTLAWLSAAGFGFSLASVVAATLMGLGRSGLQLSLALALGLATVAAVALFVPFGIAGIAVAVAVATLVMTGVCLGFLARALSLRARDVLLALAPGALGAAVMAAVLIALRAPLAELAALPQLAVLAVVGAGVYAAVVAGVAGRRLAEDLSVFRS